MRQNSASNYLNNEVGSTAKLPAAFKQMKVAGADGLISIAGAFTLLNSPLIAELTLAERIPSCHGFKFTVASGGLISLGPDMTAIAVDGATYVDKILRGAKPGRSARAATDQDGNCSQP